jgi:hypothetical protein
LRFDEKKKPNMEAAWVSERLVGEKVGEPVCGDALLRLFADEAGRYANCGVSLNFQHVGVCDLVHDRGESGSLIK